jgi:RND family efflux transporter MFP subunit
MSLPMFIGRVLLPSAGLVLAVAITWQSVKRITDRADAGPIRLQSSALDGTPPRITAEGRVVAYPGARVTVGTEVLGTITSIKVLEKAAVHKGDLLVELRSDEVQAALREAHHRLTEMESALRVEQLRNGLDRILPLVGRADSQQPDARRESLAAAIARRDAARAAIDRLEAESARYRILAPLDGVVIERHAEPGETVSPAAPLMTIVDLGRLRVEAEVDEFDIAAVTSGAPATITAEGYPPRGWSGQVEEIADAVVPRHLRPEDPARAGDTRVLRVKVAFKEPCPLKLGQRVEVSIAAHEPAGAAAASQKRTEPQAE